MGGPVAGLDDRAPMDARMLTSTSEPLPAGVQVTGIAVVTLHVASDHTDGAFLAYLEDIDAEGRSRYITEGGLRAVHRKPWKDPLFGRNGPLDKVLLPACAWRGSPFDNLSGRGHMRRRSGFGAKDVRPSPPRRGGRVPFVIFSTSLPD